MIAREASVVLARKITFGVTLALLVITSQAATAWAEGVTSSGLLITWSRDASADASSSSRRAVGPPVGATPELPPPVIQGTTIDGAPRASPFWDDARANIDDAALTWDAANSQLLLFSSAREAAYTLKYRQRILATHGHPDIPECPSPASIPSRLYRLVSGRWEELPRPPALYLFYGMAYYSALSRVIAVGQPCGSPEIQTWSYDGRSWMQLHPKHSLTYRRASAMVDDPSGQRLVLYGGNWEDITLLGGGFVGASEAACNHPPTGDCARTWTFDGSDWTWVSGPDPGVRDHTSLVFDPHANRLLLFGGWTDRGATITPRTDTWDWVVQPRASHRPAFKGPRSERPASPPDFVTFAWQGPAFTDATPSFRPPAGSYVAVSDPDDSAALLVGRAVDGAWEQRQATKNGWQVVYASGTVPTSTRFIGTYDPALHAVVLADAEGQTWLGRVKQVRLPGAACVVRSEAADIDLGATLLSGAAGTKFIGAIEDSSDGKVEASVTNQGELAGEPGTGFEAVAASANTQEALDSATSATTTSEEESKNGISTRLRGGLTVDGVLGTTYPVASYDEGVQAVGARIDEIVRDIPVLGFFAEGSSYQLPQPIKATRGAGLRLDLSLSRSLGLTSSSLSGAFEGGVSQVADVEKSTITTNVLVRISADAGADGLGHAEGHGEATVGLAKDTSTGSWVTATLRIKYGGSLGALPRASFKDPTRVYGALTEAVIHGEVSSGTDTEISVRLDLRDPDNMRALRNFLFGGLAHLTDNGGLLFERAIAGGTITRITYDLTGTASGGKANAQGLGFKLESHDSRARLIHADFYVPDIGFVPWDSCQDAATTLNAK